MKKICEKYKNIVISLGINLLLVLLAVFVFGTRYATDDDISIARIAYGTFFEPQTRVVFSGRAFGALLKGLSYIGPRINWQLIIYYMILLLGGFFSSYYTLKKNDRKLIWCWTLVVTVFYNSVYVDINFSLVASMLAFYGYVLLFIGAYEKKKWAVGFSIIFLSFSMTIRYDSFLGVSAFAFFSFVMIAIKERKIYGGGTVIKRYVVPFAIGLFLPMLLLVSDKLSYGSDEWAEYISYNDDRAQILDFPSVIKVDNKDYFEKNGLTEEMVTSIRKWQFNDTEIFSRETVSKLSEDSASMLPEISQDFFFEALGYCVEKTGKLYYFLFAFFALIVFTVKKDDTRKGNIRIYVLPWAMIVPYLIELGAFYYLDRGIDRVYRTVAIGLWCGLFALLSCGYFDVDKENETSFKVCRWACAVMIVASLFCQFEDLKDIRGFEIIDIEDADNNLDFLNDGRVYICDVGSVRAIEDAYGVWKVPGKNALYNCIELGGWLVNYPENIKKQEALEVGNPYKALAYNDNVYLLTTEDGVLQLDFLRSAYDENIESELIEKHGKISVYKYGVK